MTVVPEKRNPSRKTGHLLPLWERAQAAKLSPLIRRGLRTAVGLGRRQPRRVSLLLCVHALVAACPEDDPSATRSHVLRASTMWATKTPTLSAIRQTSAA